MQHCFKKNILILRNLNNKENNILSLSHFKWQNIKRTSLELENCNKYQNQNELGQEESLGKERRIKEMLSVNSSIILPLKKETKITNNQMSSCETILKDTFGRHHNYLRISLTERCNLRCYYCMPAEGVELTPNKNLLTTSEILKLTRLFVKWGVTKVRLTGGEPTIRRDLIDIIKNISMIDGIEKIGMTTNGLILSKKLKDLKEAGLNSINISLDTLKKERFEKITRRKGHENVLRSIDEALAIGFETIKVNVVVMKDQNDDEIIDFVNLSRYLPVNVRFIEYMPFDGNHWTDDKLVSFNEMKNIVKKFYPSLDRCCDVYGEVAKNYKISNFKGTISFITSMTNAFCSECNRIRIMADGNLKVCLFGKNEVSLRDAIRSGASDKELGMLVSRALDNKKKAHAGMYMIQKTKNRAMVKIGG